MKRKSLIFTIVTLALLLVTTVSVFAYYYIYKSNEVDIETPVPENAIVDLTRNQNEIGKVLVPTNAIILGSSTNETKEIEFEVKIYANAIFGFNVSHNLPTEEFEVLQKRFPPGGNPTYNELNTGELPQLVLIEQGPVTYKGQSWTHISTFYVVVRLKTSSSSLNHSFQITITPNSI